MAVYQLVASLPPERFAALYAALPPEARQALDAPVARVLNSRVPSVRRMPEALKVKALRAWLTREKDEALAGEMLRAYFLGPRKPLVLAFLEATGVKHEDGQVTDESEPDAARVPEAVQALLAAHERADVALYLRVAALQWPGNVAVRDALAALAA
jgi:hypothetical protein